MNRTCIKYSIIMDTLAAARDAGDEWVIEACKRCLRANALGRKMGKDWQIVLAFAS